MSRALSRPVGAYVIPPATGHPALERGNVELPAAFATKRVATLLMVGAIGLAITLIGGFVAPSFTVNIGGVTHTAGGAAHALAAYHVAVMAALAISLGGLFLTMAFHLINAGWSATIRRQTENLMMMVPVCLLLLVPVLAINALKGGVLFSWMGDRFDGDYLLGKKSAYLNSLFFYVRILIYAGVWSYLARRLSGYSLEQDRTGDRWLTARARRTSAWGMLVFALSLSFAAFDLLKGVDFRFYSTMWGVWYFASGAFSSVAALVMILAWLRGKGVLRGAVTSEHMHDMGKLLFSFTVFWAYISFSQYFLIWYGNIPEETAYYLARKTNGWDITFRLLCIGHFVAPFLILLFRKVKRTPALLSAVAAWALVIHVIDMVFVIRPMVYVMVEPAKRPGPEMWWIDIAAAVGVAGIFAGLLIKRVVASPLVAINDPRMSEALGHKNYV